MNKLPSIVTNHNGILAQNPTSSIAVSMADGRVTDAPAIPPIPAVICWTTPPHISYSFTIKSIA